MSCLNSTTTELPAPAVRRRSLSSDSLATGILFALVLTVVQRLLGGVRGVLFCRLMTDQELGQWSMLHSFLTILAPMAVLGLPGSFGKFVEHYFQQGRMRTFLRRIGWVCGASTFGLAIAIVIWPDFFSYHACGEFGHRDLMYVMAGSLVWLTLYNYLSTLMEAMRQIRLVTIMRFLSGVSFTAFGIGFLFLYPAGAMAASWAFLLSSVIGAAPALWFLWQRRSDWIDDGQPLGHREMWLRLAPFAIWWWLSNIVHNLYEISDRYMLMHFTDGPTEAAQAIVGQYHSGRVIPLLMVGVALMLSGLLLPFVAKSWAEGNVGKARQQLNWTIKLSTVGMMGANVGLLVGSGLLFDLFLEGKYNDGLAIFPLTMVYCTWFSITTVSQDFLWVSEQGKYAVLTMAAGLALNLLLNLILIPIYGLNGAVWATSLGTLVALVALFIVNQRCGCGADAGCWAAVGLPLILLLPAAWSVAAYAIFLIGIATTPWFFSATEKSQLWEMALSRFHR